MSTQLDRMKQFIEEKKKKNTSNIGSKRPEKGTVSTHKGFNNKKSGGAFDR